MSSNENIQLRGYLMRNDGAVWRNVAGQIVIVDSDNDKLHFLNKTASIIWSLADGTRKPDDIITELQNRFEVTSEQARADVDEFCQQLLEAKLVTLTDPNEKK